MRSLMFAHPSKRQSLGAVAEWRSWRRLQPNNMFSLFLSLSLSFLPFFVSLSFSFSLFFSFSLSLLSLFCLSPVFHLFSFPNIMLLFLSAHNLYACFRCTKLAKRSYISLRTCEVISSLSEERSALLRLISIFLDCFFSLPAFFSFRFSNFYWPCLRTDSFNFLLSCHHLYRRTRNLRLISQ